MATKLCEIIDSQIESRNRSILYEVCGLHTGKTVSMRSVALRRGLTAERVRQIMGQIRDQLFLAGKQEERMLLEYFEGKGAPKTPILSSEEANAFASSVYGSTVTLAGLNNLLIAIGRETSHRGYTLGDHVVLAHSDADDLVLQWRKVSMTAKRLARSRGAVSAGDVAAILASRQNAISPVAPSLIEFFLSILPSRAQISINQETWHVFDEIPSMVQRAIHFCQTAGPLTISVRNSVIYPSSLPGPKLPLDVVKFVLANYGFDITGDVATLSSKMVANSKPKKHIRHLGLSKIQNAMIRILRKGGPMLRSDFLLACEQKGLNRVTATIYLYRGYFVNKDGIVALPSHVSTPALHHR